MPSVLDFRRMLLGLPHSAADYASVEFSARLANLLGLDLVGIFARDEGLLELALLPCVRELRASGDGWQPLDLKQLELSAHHAAASARRLFDDAAKGLRGSAQFASVKGQISEAIGSLSLAGDIIVVIEPRNPAERVTYQFRRFVNVALNTGGAVLLVPSRIVRRTGPVVAVASGEHDPSLEIAQRLAEAVREDLLVVTPAVMREALSVRAGDTGPARLKSGLERTRESLIVMSRSDGAIYAPDLASELGVPVLLK